MLKVSQETTPSQMRNIIANRMEKGWSIPRVVETTEIITTQIRQILDTTPSISNASIFDFIIKAVANSLSKHPVFNSALIQGKIVSFEQINIGFAVELPAGLFVPVIRDVDKLDITSIATNRKQLVSHLQEGNYSSEILRDGTFTLSNLGRSVVDTFSPIINPPQCAILGIGAEKQRACVVDDRIEAHSTIFLSLVFDHRITDGGPAARFLTDIANCLEQPHELLGERK